MRRLRHAMTAVGAGCLAAMVAGFVGVGCGGNDNTHPTDGGSDATGDVLADNAVQDSPTPDSSHDSAPTDSPSETSPVDASDAGSPLVAFSVALATAVCNHFQPCCPALDAGSYSLARCITSFQGYGWEANVPYNSAALDRTNITINEAKAATCLASINSTNIPCGTQTAAGWSTVTAACEGVLQGTIPIGQTGCISSFECAPGAYCDTTASPGTCTALAAQGQPCDTVINSAFAPIPDEMCSYLGSSSNGMYCDLIDPVGSAKHGTCQALLASGANCENASTSYYDDQACPATGALCGDNLKCGGTTSYPYAGSGECSYVTTGTDAGGD